MYEPTSNKPQRAGAIEVIPKNITINGLNDTKNGDMLNKRVNEFLNNSKSSSSSKKSSKDKNDALSSFYDQISIAAAKYRKQKNEINKKEHYDLLAAIERQAAVGERGGMGLRELADIKKNADEARNDKTAAVKSTTDALAKKLAALVSAGDINRARALISQMGL